MAFQNSQSSSGPIESPFSALQPQQLNAICSSPGFQILRQFLATVTPNFCNEHAKVDPTVPSTWVLHRDILHAITMPVVQLYNQASELAAAALCATKVEDLELAFRGEARSAFIWLQCFILEEEDWCFTRGCPACTTLHTLSTESTIRATMAAALLSSRTPASPSTSPSQSGDEAPVNIEKPPSLPNFSAVLPALGQALDMDPFWGPGHYAHLVDRSQRLTTGIQDLIAQCEALEALVTSAPPSPTSTGLDLRRPRTIDVILPDKEKDNREIKLKKGRIAKRQARLREEQKAMSMRMVWQCWSVVSLPADQRMALRAAGRRSEFVGRKRTSTT